MSPETRGYHFRIHESPSPLARKFPSFVRDLTLYVSDADPVTSKQTYRKFLRGITDLIQKHRRELATRTPLYEKERKPIGHNELTFATPWGGVSFKEVSVKKDHVEKLLIVEQAKNPDGVLGFEYHKLKDEHLEILEGYAVFIASHPIHTRSVILTLAKPHDTVSLPPGVRHGVIPLTNLVIKETSTCDLDASDLLFVF